VAAQPNMNAIIGFGEMLAADHYRPFVGRQTEYVGFILESAKRLLALVQEVLSFASIDAALIRVHIEPVVC
jgi:signal transduction histidine kinase